MESESADITGILRRWEDDRDSAIEQLTPIVYAELRKIAVAFLRRARPDHTLQPTALVHEAYLKLVKQDGAIARDRSHFYALAARMMRQILVDTARARKASKRGSGEKVPFDDRMGIDVGGSMADFYALHEALEKLEAHNARTSQTVELRYFGGLQLEEIAEALGTSLATVKRDLALGQAWLKRALAAQ